MQSEADYTGGSRSTDSMVHRMKIAVALACLRSKPVGMSGRQYAHQLCDNFQRSQLAWRERYKGAEMEILHLRQQLILQQHNRHTGMDTDAGSTDFGSGSQSIFPTPPPSASQARTDLPHAPPQLETFGNSLVKHTTFLHHMVNIQSASHFTDQEISVTKQSLAHSLHCIAEHLGQNVEDIPLKVETHCVATICKLTDGIDTNFTETVIDKVQALAAMVVDKLLHARGPCKQRSARLTRLLTQLGTCKHFCPSLLKLLIDQLVTFSGHLRKISDNTEETLDPAYFCNVYPVFRTVEAILQHVAAGDSGVLGDIVADLQCRLDDSLLYITDHFPLFAHAVWRLSARMSLLSNGS